MRVLHIAPSFAPAWIYGGPVQSVYQLCLHQAQLGNEVQVLTTNSSGIGEDVEVPPNQNIELDSKFQVLYCRRWFRHSVSPFLLWILPRYLRQAQVIHLTGVYSFPTIPCLILCKWLNLPVVWSPRGSLQRWSGSRRENLKAMWENFCRMVLPENLVLHVTSQEEEIESKEKIPNVRYVVVPNGVDIPQSINTVHSHEAFRLLFLGRLDPKKGLENLLVACRYLKEQGNVPFTLVIAGSGNVAYVNSIETYIEDLGLDKEVQMCGLVEGKEKTELFGRSDVTIVPSHTENFGMVIAESLAHGVPVIASKSTPWKQMEERGCGLWVLNDSDSLAQALFKIRNMDLKEMGLRGRRWMQEEFSWSSVAMNMCSVYKELLN